MIRVRFLLVGMFVVLAVVAACFASEGNLFSSLSEISQIEGFDVEAVYEDSDGKAVGARFQHQASGFVLDLFAVESSPQAFMYVNAPPPSNMGEPHTCEHLVLGKGTVGRYVASLEDMSLGSSTAGTGQIRTCYHFNTSAGMGVFFDLMEAKLDALMHPNFTDEEIRREVCNMGVSVDPVDSSLRLEEKGTVYAEMVTAFERPWSGVYNEMGRLLYGVGHPLALSAGGMPDSIRAMTPDDLNQFHRDAYRLGNTGMIVAAPASEISKYFLARVDEMLDRIDPEPEKLANPSDIFKSLPEPRPGPEGTICLSAFPHQNPDESGHILFVWPPVCQLDAGEDRLLRLFVSSLGSGQTSNLYRRLIDSESREMDLGASSVFAYVSTEPGNPVFLGLTNVRRDALTEQMIDSVRSLIVDEVSNLTKLDGDSEELREFNRRVRSLIIEQRRELKMFLGTPPRFGFRGADWGWLERVQRLHDGGGTRRRLTLDSEYDFAEEQLSLSGNIWTELVSEWHFLDTKPYAVAAVADPELAAQNESARDERIATFVETLKLKYDVSTDDEAIQKYKEEYDANTAIIDEAAAQIEMPGFTDSPPMTLDDQLLYRVDTMIGGRPLVVSTFDNMSGTSVGLAFRMGVVPRNDLFYVAALPSLMTDVGVIRDGVPVPFDDMADRLRREVRDLYAYYDVNYNSERVELVVYGSGADLSESMSALEWMGAVLYEPDWREENLPRIRDVIDQRLSAARSRMRGSEESWVNDPANAYLRQSNPLILSSSCFLTRAHALHRLRWQLKEAEDENAVAKFGGFMMLIARLGSALDRDGINKALVSVGQDGSDVDSLSPMAMRLRQVFGNSPEGVQVLIRAAMDDILKGMAEMPDMSLGGDIGYLCRQMVSDLKIAPSDALGKLSEITAAFSHQDNFRAFMIASSDNQPALIEGLTTLVSRLDSTPVKKVGYRDTPIVVERMQQRTLDVTYPLYVGLVNENTRSGVHLNSAPLAGYRNFDESKLLDFMAGRLYGGGGAHSMFMKTWSAGLAYSNGLRSSERSGRVTYYAERCPDLAQTMQFVVDQLKAAPVDSSLAGYAVAQAFSVNRSASRYERRGEAIAADLADGIDPKLVSQFRQGVLDLRGPKLYDKLRAQMENVYGRVLPGYGPVGKSVPDAIYFSIGPEKQMQSWEQYLQSVESGARLFRLYPRDFWIIN